MIAYLSGPMENAPKSGSIWREDITKWLKENLGHIVIDPVIESRAIIEKTNSYDYKLWKVSNPEKYKNFLRSFIDNDLNLIINKADYLIVLWDQNVLKGGGTHGEITISYYINKPVYLVNRLPKYEISGWIFSCATGIYNSFDELKIDFKKKFNK